MNAMHAGVNWVARVRAWPLWVRWILMIVPIGAVFGGAVLVMQPGLWIKALGMAMIGVATPSMLHAKRLLGLCFQGDGTMRTVERRYMREMTLPLTAYMMIVVIVMPLIQHDHGVALRVVLALLPVVPIAFIVRAIVRYVMGSDELEQRTHLQALAVSAGVVGMVSITAGFLATAGVLKLDGRVLLWVFPALMVVYGLTRAWVVRRYRDERGE